MVHRLLAAAERVDVLDPRMLDKEAITDVAASMCAWTTGVNARHD
jgi:hypothetical protein